MKGQNVEFNNEGTTPPVEQPQTNEGTTPAVNESPEQPQSNEAPEPSVNEPHSTADALMQGEQPNQPEPVTEAGEGLE